nr:hypothetical protein [Tanacetum cinerariifolium]
MHNNIMAAGSRDRPPMLAPGRYPQWHSRFLRQVDTRPNNEALRKCILSCPYKPTTVLVQAVKATDNSPAVPEHTTVEAPTNMSPENKAHILAEKEDVKTNLFWEFEEFTSHDEETMESYYTRFYKLMNEIISNNLTVTTMLVNVQFLQQLQPELSSNVTLDSPDMCKDDIQNDQNDIESDDEHSQMHNNIMAAGSRDRPPMLAPGRSPQWHLRFLRQVDTRPYNEALKKCILSGPYKPTTVLVQAIKATDNSPAVPEHTTVETPMNMSPENKAHILAEKEAIHLILTGIGDDIYLTVDACQMEREICEAIERLQQGESLNIQDVKTNLFWEFGEFTSHDGETMESYYTRFYKLMNEIISNNLTVTTMQVNVQFLQQLQPELSRFVMIVKQQHKLDEVSYHKLFDILKQYQNEVNELRAKKLAKNANPLALVRTVNVAGTREKVGSPVVQKSRTQCFNCKEYGHFTKECRKPKRVKDSAYHKEKMLLCKQAEQGVPLQAEQYD